MTFLDSRCRAVCPVEGQQLASALRRLAPAERPVLLVVSIDPWQDTPRSERAFAARSRWSTPWHWLNGTTTILRPVWRRYAIGVKRTKRDVMHSNAVYLIDRQGYERGGYLVPFAPAALAHDARVLATS